MDPSRGSASHQRGLACDGKSPDSSRWRDYWASAGGCRPLCKS
nr:MAG TPA: hypothetical protein [Caudoviricetes sp.]